MKVGLIGAKLGHSFSKLIHEELCDYKYDLIELNEAELHQFMQAKQFDAINVTIPYKETVIPYCDEISEQALNIHAINTIKNVNGKLIATNTDFEGLKATIEHNNILIEGKHCLILGTGGTSKTAKAVLQAMRARSIQIAGRNLAKDVLPYEDLHLHTEIQVLINATSVGMYPNTDQQLIDCTLFPTLEAVVDVIYNPLRTKLTMQAERLGLKHANGLEMLVTQAKIAAEFFLDRKIEDEKIQRLIQSIQSDLRNIVLIGMPSCGKTTIASELAKRYDKKVIDLDEEIVKSNQQSIKSMFEEYGEAYFRAKEHETCCTFAKENKQIISTGGGIIKRLDNIEALKQNGIIIHVRRNLDELLVDESRPLSKDHQALEAMEKERLPIYTKVADIEIDNNGTIEEALLKIEEALA